MLPRIYKDFSKTQLKEAKKIKINLERILKSNYKIPKDSHQWVTTGTSNVPIGKSRISGAEGSMSAPRYRVTKRGLFVKHFTCKKCGLIRKDI